MKAYKFNVINSITLISLGVWGYFSTSSFTAFIPSFFGLVLLLCHSGVKKENKIIAHIAVLLTLIILVALIGMRLPKSLETGGIGLYRVIVMIITSSLAMVSFVNSFIQARKSK